MRHRLLLRISTIGCR